MKKILFLILTLSVPLIVFSGCAHQHTWQDATCTTAKICTECSETEGEALGHSWKEATCIEPKTCTICEITEGSELGHSWQDATCTKPKTCSICGKTEGEKIDHKWKAATCQNPKICSVCGKTEGKKKEHKWKKADCVHPKTCTECKKTEGKALGHTCNIGVCKRCKDIVNEELIYEINDTYGYVTDNIDNAMLYIKQINKYSTTYVDFMYMNMAQDCEENNRKYLNELYKLCGDYPELANFKKKLKAECDAIPVKRENSDDRDAFVEYAKKIIKYINVSSETMQEYINIMDAFGMTDSET